MLRRRLIVCVCFGRLLFACSNPAFDSTLAAGPDSSAGSGSDSSAGSGSDSNAGSGSDSSAGSGGADTPSQAGAASETASGGAAGDGGADTTLTGGTAPSGAGSAGNVGSAGPPVTVSGGGDGPVTVPGGGDVTSVVTSPLILTPSFDPSIYDYYVRCAAGDNALTVTSTDGNGTASQQLTLTPDQLAAVDSRYWIHCLPSDFPTITVTRGGTPTPGYYLVNSSLYGTVLDTNGVPVWYTRGSAAINVALLAPNTLSLMPNYKPDLGNDSTTPFEILSLTSDSVTTVASPDGQTDVHEFETLANGDHLLFTAPLTTGVDLTGLQSFGADSAILDCKVLELSPSGDVVWSWLASDHVDPARESLEPLAMTALSTDFVDVFHCNSIAVDDIGNLMISMREANAVFYVNRSTGQVEWKLGGTAYNKDGAALIAVQGDSQTTFSMQHDARFLPNGDVSLFDDHGAGPGVARGIEYAIDHVAGVATPVFQFLGTAASLYQGSFRRYADGASVIGWGYVPTDPRTFTEVDATGKDVFDVAFGAGNVSYRAVKVPLSDLDIGLLRSASGK